METKWRLVQDRGHSFTAEGYEGSQEQLPDGTWRDLYTVAASGKFDGCVDLRSYVNGYDVNHQCEGDSCPCCVQSIHICDLDDLIQQLQALKAFGQAYFKGKTGEVYWKAKEQA